MLRNISLEKIDKIYKEKFEPSQLETNSILTSKKQAIVDLVQSGSELIIYSMTYEEELQLKDILEGKDVDNIDKALLENCLVFEIKDGNKIKYIIPEETKEILKEVQSSEVKKDKAIFSITRYLDVHMVVEKNINIAAVNRRRTNRRYTLLLYGYRLYIRSKYKFKSFIPCKPLVLQGFLKPVVFKNKIIIV